MAVTTQNLYDWILKNWGKKVTLKIVTSLPTSGLYNTIYLTNNQFYYWDGSQFINVGKDFESLADRHQAVMSITDRDAIPVEDRSLYKLITYRDENQQVFTARYDGVDLTDAEWIDSNNWVNITGAYELINQELDTKANLTDSRFLTEAQRNGIGANVDGSNPVISVEELPLLRTHAYIGTFIPNEGFPTTGTGEGNTIKKGNIYQASVASTLTGIGDFQVGDFLVALIDNPGTDPVNWAFIQGQLLNWTNIYNGPTATPSELDTAATKAHDQNTDQYLDQGGLNEVSAAQTKTAYDHSQTAHAPSDAEKNIQSDWNQADGAADDYIKNKPDVVLQSEKGAANGVASTDADGLVPVSQLPAAVKESTVVADIAARDALTSYESLRVHVLDATADSTVASGGAGYIYHNSTWYKTYEDESLDQVIDWTDVQNKPTSSPANIDDAVNKRHVQDADQYLDYGGTYQVSAQQASTAYTHSQTSHAPADADKNVQADWNQTDSLLDSYIKNKPDLSELHTHSNRTILDLITAAGSGSIITSTERTKLTNIEENAQVNVQADWNQVDNLQDDFIKNKPDLSNLHAQGTDQYLDYGGTSQISATQAKTAYTHSQSTHAPTDAEKNVQSDWGQADNTSSDFIKNKPSETPVEFVEFDLIQFINKATQTADFTITIPANYKITSIVIEETAAADAGNISIGTTSGGNDVVNGTSVGASALVNCAIGKSLFSKANDQTLYVSSNAWGSGSITIDVRIEKISA